MTCLLYRWSQGALIRRVWSRIQVSLQSANEQITHCRTTFAMSETTSITSAAQSCQKASSLEICSKGRAKFVWKYLCRKLVNSFVTLNAALSLIYTIYHCHIPLLTWTTQRLLLWYLRHCSELVLQTFQFALELKHTGSQLHHTEGRRSESIMHNFLVTIVSAHGSSINWPPSVKYVMMWNTHLMHFAQGVSRILAQSYSYSLEKFSH